jgi:hypothetical protein
VTLLLLLLLKLLLLHLRQLLTLVRGLLSRECLGLKRQPHLMLMHLLLLLLVLLLLSEESEVRLTVLTELGELGRTSGRTVCNVLQSRRSSSTTRRRSSEWCTGTWCSHRVRVRAVLSHLSGESGDLCGC